MNQQWWQQSVVYQIYPKSFNDTTGNGIGDIQGIIEKLDYLQTLGVDVIWLTPIYASPQRDNGYDISDYYSIDPMYGTMADFEELLQQAHQKGIKVIMDIVVNHTSTEHEWFQQAKRSKQNPYRDFYIWQDGNDGDVPTNWQSKFGGSAWQYDDTTKQYYLHLFDVTQADLNWENEQVRNEVYQMMNFWLDKGVDGFRLDVINLISKDQRFPNDVPPGDGRTFYTDGPRVHEFLHEMNQNVFKGRQTMTVGEMSSTTVEDCVKYTRPEREELDMTFQFHHLKVDYPNGEKWTKAPFDFLELKRILSKWQVQMHQGGGWNALFWCNHDQPRIVSRFGDDQTYHKESAKMLATTIHMMQGTPYIYQGEEFGMTNPGFDSITDYQDVESINMYKMKKEEGMPEEEILSILQEKSRDNSRTPVQWNSQPHAGFTTGTPWLKVPSSYEEINAQKAVDDPSSIFYHYQSLIHLRKQYEVITDGDYRLIFPDHHAIFAYIRENDDEQLLVINNFYGEDTVFALPENIGLVHHAGEVLLANYPDVSRSFNQLTLRPYESIVYYLTK
ncbi:alpha,alpha-phosphotrehalase [Gracilibacillus halophilus YIM-C55.5]|uniref:Alpha,alpha-phosphotrehalase n=1 Tax=Gracilibacillus halophilus YIM-C55.5 TaxID=1308866 RepID=N4WV05_9BACI|nr:alpha,alpha-phosphotrehalase [Gracilibacillus halophilus]ENH98180.1 alpha,alpha-phosphotrehalase [Gracilibacillus halophilus YIM-C55.5]